LVLIFDFSVFWPLRSQFHENPSRLFDFYLRTFSSLRSRCHFFFGLGVGGMGLTVLAFRRVLFSGSRWPSGLSIFHPVIGQSERIRKVSCFSQSGMFCKYIAVYFVQAVSETLAMQATQVYGFVCFPTHRLVVRHSLWRCIGGQGHRISQWVRCSRFSGSSFFIRVVDGGMATGWVNSNIPPILGRCLGGP
jgi:hypothetical protein